MRCRKDFMDLTPAERDRLADALNELYASGVITTYANAHDAGWFDIHRGPAFLPWHRWFILRLEQELRAYDARIALPYWNWTRADSRDLDAEPWLSFFGGRANSGGRFDHWDYTRAPTPGTPGLSTQDNVIDELQADTYLAFRGMEFGSHVGGHTWTGSPGHTMASTNSPGDPLFYLHHCMVDRLWAIWQLNNPGADQYTLDDDPDYLRYDDTFVPMDEPMFGGAIGGGVTPASMLDHRTLDYYYDRDDALEARVLERGLPEIISGDPVAIELETPEIVFNDVPEGETAKRAALFRISGCGPVTFRIIAEPGDPFSLFASGPYPFPAGGFPTDELRIWLLYTAGAAGTTATGTVSIAAEDEFGNEIDRWEDIPILANAVTRPRVAVVAVLDESGSMLYDAGNNRTRLHALQLAADAFIDLLFDDNGIGLVAFSDDAQQLTGLDEAGPLTSLVRNNARDEIIIHGPPDIYRHTSIGAGLEKAAELYSTAPTASDYDIQATLVFTDGVEDRPPYISDVAELIGDRVYAIGVADAANVNSDALRAIANDTGGYMLVTGALSVDDEFLLEKFFIQILAGVTNRDIVRDPAGWIVPGRIERVPFRIARSDIAFDAIALSRAPQYVVLGLQTPDGTVVTSGQVPAGAYRIGRSSGSFRITLPLVIDSQEHWEGEWQLLLGLRWKPHRRVSIHAPVETAPIGLGQSITLPYHAVIHAYSNLRLRARVDQSGLAPGSDIHVRAVLTEYGQPLETSPGVTARVKRPDGTETVLTLQQSAPGEFDTTVIGHQSGVYRFRLMAEGLTSRGQPFTREHLLSALIGRERRPPPGAGDGREALCELLRCLLQQGGVDEAFEKRLKGWGIDVEALRPCVARLCGPERGPGR